MTEGSSQEDATTELMLIQDGSKPAFNNAQANAKLFSQYLKQGEALHSEGQYSEARNRYELALNYSAFKAQNAMAYIRIANTYREEGKIEKELEFVIKAIENTTGSRVKKQELARAEILREEIKSQLQR